jgi:glycosyltransferase involved in cell wall biosynthesis
MTRRAVPAAFLFQPKGATMMATRAQMDIGSAPPSVCAGVAIAVPDGLSPIEALVAGDLISTNSANTSRLAWVGRSRIDPRLLAVSVKAKFLPIRVAAGALAPGLPLRDLDVSPATALWLDGGLVEAAALINGTTITQPDRDTAFEYWQVAVAGGGLMLVESVAIATLEDAGWGNSFADPTGLVDLPAVAQLARLGPEAIAQVAARLRAWAALIHPATTTDPGLRLVVDGRIILPSRVDGDIYAFQVTGGATDVRLTSRAIVPAEMPDAGADKRRLGVFVLGITLRGPHMRFDIDPLAANLRNGWHPVGAGQLHCWTDGYALLPAPPFALMGDAFEVEIRIAGPSLGYRADPVHAAPIALVLDASLPTPDRDAGSNVMVEHIKLLQGLGYAIIFVPLHNFARISPYAEALEALGVEVIHRPRYNDLRYLMASRGERFAFAYVHRLWVAEQALPVLRHFRPDLKIIFNTADLHHLRSQRAAALTGDADAAAAAELERTRELTVIAAADATIVCNSVERDLLSAALPDAKLVYLPWVRAAEVGAIPDYADRSGIMFLGGFNHPPNGDGITWFVREVMPKLRVQVPGISLTIYGADMTPEVFALAAPDVVVVGYVAALKTAFDRHRISVAPLRYGAGFKGKVAESLAHGVPVVASPIAAEGTGLVDGAEMLVAADAETMAAAIASAYGNKDLWQSLSRTGQAFVARRLSPAEGQRVIGQVLEDLGLPPPSVGLLTKVEI